MDEQRRKLTEAIYKIRSKEKMIRASYEKGTGTTRAFLEDRIREAAEKTEQELNSQVEQGYFTKQEAAEILEALSTMPVIREVRQGILVATFPEFKLNELYVQSVAIELNDSNGQTEKEERTGEPAGITAGS